MEEKAGRPKRPDNSLHLLMPNYEQKKFVKKTNKQTIQLRDKTRDNAQKVGARSARDSYFTLVSLEVVDDQISF